MFKNIFQWGSTIRGKEDDYREFPRVEMRQDFDLGSKEFNVINKRIQRYLRDDEVNASYDRDVDDTLRLIMDETGRWSRDAGSELNRRNDDYVYERQLPSAARGYQRESQNKTTNTDDFEPNDDDDDDLLAYCLRLEENNSYLLDIVQRFEEISFQKKYNEVTLSNDRLEKEVERLKTSNSKVYSSYCDLVDEVKRLRLERSETDKQQQLLARENELLRRRLKRLDTMPEAKSTLKPALKTELKTESKTEVNNELKPGVKQEAKRVFRSPVKQCNIEQDDTMNFLRRSYPRKNLS